MITRVAANCTAGEYLLLEERRCKPCARGTYQSNEWQLQCDNCTLNKTTLGLGSKHESDCVSKYLNQLYFEQDNTSTGK